METHTFVNMHLPWIVTLAVALIISALGLAKKFGKQEAQISVKVEPKECAKVRASCVRQIKSDMEDEIEKLEKDRKEEMRYVWDAIEEARKKGEENGEAFARTEGSLTKAVSVLEDAVKELREFRKTNGTSSR